ncbi:hypothetical protein KI387_038507, partial [Taxus chinensis]
AGRCMADKATEKLDLSCKSRAKTVKVVHIGDPTMVTASESEFRAVVQSLTGKKRKSSPSTASTKINWGCDESIRVKEPTLSGSCPIPNSIPQPAITNHMPAIFTDSVYTSEVQQRETMS